MFSKKVTYLRLILPVLVLTFGLIATNWQLFPLKHSKSSINRSFASIPDRLEMYLAVDRFHYYTKEFTNFFTGKLDDNIIQALTSIRPEHIINQGFSLARLEDVAQYDNLIHEILKRQFPTIRFNPDELRWNYLFFKNKLNESFSIGPARLTASQIEQNTELEQKYQELSYDRDLKAIDMTLDSDHYISNRMTRAVFWEASESGRTIEFHIGDERSFLKTISQNAGEIVATIQPMGRNYNKIFLVKYPSDPEAHIAITNVGGSDRLEHLAHHLTLSNLFNQNLTNQMNVYGELEQYHQELSDKLTRQLTLLPKSDQVVIGQKGAVEAIFNALESLESLRLLYKSSPNDLLNLSGPTTAIQNSKKIVLGLLQNSATTADVINNQGHIQKIFTALRPIFDQKPNLISPSFEIGGTQSSLADISFYSFQKADGQIVRWTSISNTWGDEIVPLLNAIRATNHGPITYIGTAGAFPESGFKVGDLVIPENVSVDDNIYSFKGRALKVPQAKQKGTVVHIPSPFQETTAWLAEHRSKADLVEIETSYIARAFSEKTDQARVYLLVSDILGSEGETLANAGSSSRKASLNRLLTSLFEEHDVIHSRPAAYIGNSLLEKVRATVNNFFDQKTTNSLYQHYIISHFIEKGEVPDTNAIKSFISENTAFSDVYFTDRLEGMSRITALVSKTMKDETLAPQISLSKELLDGTWNPKTDHAVINFHTDNQQIAQKYKEILDRYSREISNIDKYAEFKVVRGPPPPNQPHYLANEYDQDVLVKIFSEVSVKRTGLDYQVGNTGKLRFQFLPTVKSNPVCSAPQCSLAFFAPDAETEKLLQLFKLEEGALSAKSAMGFLTGNIDLFNSSTNYPNFKSSGRIVNVDQLADGKLAEILPIFSPEKGLVIEIRMTPQGLKNSAVILEEAIHFNQIISRGVQSWAEIQLNAEAGSIRSQKALLDLEVEAMKDFMFTVKQELRESNPPAFVQDYVNKRLAHAEKKVLEIGPLLAKENQARNKLSSDANLLQAIMDKEEVKLNDLIAKGNRKEVRRLIEGYLPWEQFEPTEIAAWKVWLDAIEFPSKDPAEKVIVFRGLSNSQGDVKQTAEGGWYFMSTLLTKNQGNFNRRLRSLKTYHDKLYNNKMLRNPNKFNVEVLGQAFIGHSLNPIGSPWMSATNYNKAQFFASYANITSPVADTPAIAAFHLDKKRFILNYASNYADEYERMIPLIVFPDEVVAVNPYKTLKEAANFQKLVESRIGRPLRKDELEQNGTSNLREHAQKATQQWWETIQPLKEVPAGTAKSCTNILKLFKK